MSDTRVGHCKKDPTDVYAGRGPGGRHMNNTPIGDRGWLGNPYPVDDHDSREVSVLTFAVDFVDRILNEPEFADAVEGLHGSTLGCWCQTVDEDAPACHAEIIAEWADRLHQPEDGECFQCHECGREYEFEGERVVCWCGREETVVVKPCGVCGKPTRTAEICADCADEMDGDAVTPTWGKHRDLFGGGRGE